MNPDVDFAVWSSERAQRVALAMDRLLPASDAEPAGLHAAMRYAALGGGKRVRALLAYAGGECCRADPADVDASAAAVELIHAYSLVHDDLPCMDDDVLRRGKPTLHVAYDEATALLAGDALHSLAFEVIASAPRGAFQAASLAHASGSRGMAGGQALDLAAVGVEAAHAGLERMHRLKTGALIGAAVCLGASCGAPLGDDELAALERYAGAIGLAFQVVDDVLDVEGTEATLGKTAGKDAAQGKPTYVALLGLAGARARVQALHAEATEALQGFGSAARRLREIATWITTRDR